MRRFSSSRRTGCARCCRPRLRDSIADKLPIYAEHGVAHVWLVDPGEKTLECLALDGRTDRLLKTYSNEDRVRVEPFSVFELELALL